MQRSVSMLRFDLLQSMKNLTSGFKSELFLLISLFFSNLDVTRTITRNFFWFVETNKLNISVRKINKKYYPRAF